MIAPARPDGRRRVAPVRVLDPAERERLVLANLGLVGDVLRREFRCKPGTPAWNDLFQVGVLGLLRAVDRFDPARGCRLSTYASCWIYQAVMRSLRDEWDPIRIPNYLHDLREAVRRGDLNPTTLPPRRRRFLEAALAASPVGRLGPGVIGPVAPAEVDSAGWEAREEAERLRAGLAALPARERAVLELRYGLGGEEPLTHRQVAARVGMRHGQSVGQAERRALGRLRQMAGIGGDRP